MATAVREEWNDRRPPERAARESNRGGEASSAARKARSRPLTYKGATGGVFKNAAVRVLRHERRLMTTGEVTKTAVRMGFIGSLPGKTPEATMASALYTDIKRWKAGIPGSVFCRPKEGLFGLREWSSDPALAPLVASEKDDPFFKPGGRGGESAKKHDEKHDEKRGKNRSTREKLRGSSWSNESDASAHIDTGKKGKKRSTTSDRADSASPPVGEASSDEEEGLRLLLDAAVGMGGAAADRARGAKPSASAVAVDVENSRDITITVVPEAGPASALATPSTENGADGAKKNSSDAKIEKTRVVDEPKLDAAATEKTRASAAAAAGAWGDVSTHASASAPKSASGALMTAISAHDRHLDGVVQALSARCAELYVLLGPHAIVARELAVLVVALRGGGARYALQEKVVTEQLWALARALAFPGGFGETAETRAALARVVVAAVDEAASSLQSLRLSELDEAAARRATLAASAAGGASDSPRESVAGDDAAASRLLASLQKTLDGGASASASAYAALAAAAVGPRGGGADAPPTRTTLPTTPPPPPGK